MFWLPYLVLTSCWNLARSDFIECPATPEFQACSGCFQVFSVPRCMCDDHQIGILGKCIYPAAPCSTSHFSLMYNNSEPGFQIWDSWIVPLLEKTFEDARNSTIPTNPLPDFLNNYDFKNMKDQYKNGWIIAYLITYAFQPELSAFPDSFTFAKLYEAMDMVKAMQKMDFSSKWQAAKNFANKLLSTNFTQNTLYAEINTRVGAILPCHSCNIYHGIVSKYGLSFCQMCPPNCRTCIQDILECVECDDRYYYEEGNCKKCKTPFCLECSPDACFDCESGFTLKNNICVPCNNHIGCSECEEGIEDKCLECNHMLYSLMPTENGTCFVCSDSACLQCINFEKCLTCMHAYYPTDSGTCQACPSKCNRCSSKTSCIQCMMGYGLVSGKCLVCADSACAECDNNNQLCTGCFAGFKYNSTTRKCQIGRKSNLCHPGCKYCYPANPQQCFACQDSYYLDQKHCKKCMTGCKWCSDSASCGACVPGYIISNGICIQCPDFCIECQPNNTSSCLRCAQGYYISNSTCEKSQVSSCLTFDEVDTTTEKCLICKPGYVLNTEKVCIHCHASCWDSCNLSNISECTITRLSHLINQTMGMMVEPGCGYMMNGDCLVPEPGYQINENNGKKQARLSCLSPCASCNSTSCLSCLDAQIQLNLVIFIDIYYVDFANGDKYYFNNFSDFIELELRRQTVIYNYQ